MVQRIILLSALFLSATGLIATTPSIYLIPGQGSDYRLYKNLNIDSSYTLKDIEYFIPNEGTSMNEFARQLALQIDTTQPFIIVGVSLGGMLATEMTTFLNPEKTIIISSAKCRQELPGRYTIQRHIPFYKWIPGKISKQGALVMQPIVEPDRRHEKETCIAMLNDKHPDFMERTIAMILEWEREAYPPGIIHIHGDNDHTIPIRNVEFTNLVDSGSHMMVLTRGEDISFLIDTILREE